MDKKNYLKIENLSLHYESSGRKIPIYEDFNLVLYQGEKTVILGESGSGKSTLAQVLMGILPSNAIISSGTLIMDDGESQIDLTQTQSLNKLGASLDFSLIFQDASQALNPGRTIYQHFEALLKLKGLKPVQGPYKYARDLLSQVNFSDPDRVLASKPQNLSGGMSQRVCIALALASSAQLIIGDEPTSALDQLSAQEVVEALKVLDEQTLLVITHDLDIATQLADRILVIRDGAIIEENNNQIISQPKEAYTQSLVESYKDLKVACQEPLEKERPAILELKNVVKTYQNGPNQHQVINGLNLTLHEGEILGILGESGSGKSTLAKLIVGLEEADAGSAHFLGQDLFKIRRKDRLRLAPNLQMIFQEARASLNPNYRCVDLVQEVLINTGAWSKKDRIERAYAYLERAGLPADLAEKRPGQLSTGQCQRVAIVRGVISNPEVLVCDEIVSSLDQNIQGEILDLLLDLQENLNMSLIFISHDLNVVKAICHEVAVIYQGQIIAQGRIQDLAKNPHPYVQKFFENVG